MTNYKTTVYPFVRELLPYYLPWTKTLLERSKFDFTGLIDPNIYDDAMDIAYLDNRLKTGTQLGNDLHASLGRSDTLLVPASAYPHEVRDRLFSLMQKNLSDQKNVFCGHGLSEQEEAALQQAGDKYGVEFISSKAIASRHGQRLIEVGREKKRLNIQKIDTPIVFVADTAPPSNAMDIATGIICLMEQKGYKVSAVLDPGNAQLFGFHGWDEVFVGKYDIMRIDEYVHDINSYFVGLDYIEKPELIVVKLPKGPIPIFKYENNAFGIYTQMFFHALNPDYFTFCMLSGSYDHDDLFQYRDLYEKRFGHSFDSVHISNAMLDVADLFDREYFPTVYQSQEQVDSYIEEKFRDRTNFPVVNGLKLEGITQLCNHVEETFTSYTSCTSII